MKKVLIFIVVLVLGLGLTGCKSHGKLDDEDVDILIKTESITDIFTGERYEEEYIYSKEGRLTEKIIYEDGYEVDHIYY